VSTTAAGLVQASIPDDMGVKFRFDAFPWMAQLQEWAGGIQATCLIVVGILAVVGVGMWVAGRLSSSQQMQKVSGLIVLWALIGAIVISVIFAAMVWATGFRLGF
jgi:heme/copper-type cytochrome/quinol oxidase subunit 2